MLFLEYVYSKKSAEMELEVSDLVDALTIMLKKMWILNGLVNSKG